MSPEMAAEDVRRVLWDKLLAARMVPPEHVYSDFRTLVSREGARLWAVYAPMVERDGWTEAVAGLPRPLKADDPQRMLGFGWWMTQFLIAPLDLDPERAQRVADLGALANLVVAVYDVFVDAGLEPDVVLSPGALDTIRRKGRSRGRKNKTLEARITHHLVSQYFADLGSLSAHGDDGVRTLLEQAIVRMHAAEAALTRSPLSQSTMLLRRKMGLPFVVQGLPGWLGLRESNSALCRWHLRWSYRVGNFIGRVDDAIDLSPDRVASEPNVIALELATRSPEEITSQIVGAGRRCIDEWLDRLPHDRAGVEPLSWALPAAVYSWFGASRVQP